MIWYDQHGVIVWLALLVIVIVLLATGYSFRRKRYLDRGPKKGEAARPGTVRSQNPPDH